jgi:hypothetical protein
MAKLMIGKSFLAKWRTEVTSISESCDPADGGHFMAVLPSVGGFFGVTFFELFAYCVRQRSLVPVPRIENMRLQALEFLFE